MTWTIRRLVLSSLFSIHSGDFHSTAELGDGDIPLISCGDADNGLVGYFDVPVEKQYHNSLTVAYNGSWPLLAKFHPYVFGAKDDVAVLTPLSPMRSSTLFYMAALLNDMTWRYSYGRKCFRAKLRAVSIPIPVDKHNKIDEDAISHIYPRELTSFIPKANAHQLILTEATNWHEFPVGQFFAIKRGDFHSLTALGPGNSITVSRATSDNGVVGRYERPDSAEAYPRGSITVSTVGGDAFVQMEDFIATDNILVLSPKKPLKIATLFFIAMMLNLQKWRYSYGRQCYKAKFSAVTIPLPVQGQDELDESYMESVATNTTYWPFLHSAISKGW